MSSTKAIDDRVSCGNCAADLNLSWKSCNRCGTLIETRIQNCNRCYLIIPKNSKFCPFCAIDQSMIIEAEDQFPLRVDKLIPQYIEFKDHNKRVERKHISGSLKFNVRDIDHILNSKQFFRSSLYVILISGLFFGFTLLFSEVLFDRLGSDPRDELRRYIRFTVAQILALLILIIITRFVLMSLDVESSYSSLSGYFSIWATVSIVKDILMYPVMFYILIFEGTEGAELLRDLTIIMMVLFFTFLFMHLIVLMKNVNRLGILINVLIVGLISIVVSMLMAYSNQLLIAILKILI